MLGSYRRFGLSVDTDIVLAVTMPQVNVNDEEVTLIGWHVKDGERAVAGEPLCEVETSKAVGDVPAPSSGVFRAVVQVAVEVPIAHQFGACSRFKAKGQRPGRPGRIIETRRPPGIAECAIRRNKITSGRRLGQ